MAECTLFGAFGWLIQGLLGLLCFSSLIIKRYRERPRRTWTIFSMDASKQAISAGLAHTMNVLIAYLMSEWDSENQCVWYFINIVIDCSIGVFISFLLLKATTSIALKYGYEQLRTGEYLLTTDRPDCLAWGLQVCLWCLVITITKWALVGVIYLLRSFLSEAGLFILSPVSSDPQLMLVIVMVFVPCLMNVVQFWVQDNFLKAKPHTREPGKSLIDLNSTFESIDTVS